MSLSLKILPALALAIALSPLAAQAHCAYAATQTVHLSKIMTGSETIDSKIMTGSETIDYPAVIYGGVSTNSFPDSFGG
jgi:hypothetical protein